MESESEIRIGERGPWGEGSKNEYQAMLDPVHEHNADRR